MKPWRRWKRGVWGGGQAEQQCPWAKLWKHKEMRSSAGFGRAGLCFARLVLLLLMRGQWRGPHGPLASPRCSTSPSLSAVVACLLLSRSTAEVEKFPVLPLSTPLYTSTDLKLPLGLLFCSWYDCRSFSCFLEVVFCGLWRALLCCRCFQSSLCVSSSGSTWWVTRAVGKDPTGLTGEREEPLQVQCWETAFAESCLCKYNLAYSILIALANKIALSSCTVPCLIPTVSVAQDSLTPISIKLLSEFHFKIIQDPWENECLVSALHHSLLL